MATILKRVCYLHAGTHRTGTTSLQAFLAMNESAFAKDGILLPRTGRIRNMLLPLPGRRAREGFAHHNLAWDLNGDPRFRPRRGTFAGLLEELRDSSLPAAVLSSEEFEGLYAAPDVLHRLNAALARIAYETVPIIYLRDQAGYAASLYSELRTHGLRSSIEEFVGAILSEGRYIFRERWIYCFTYKKLADAFASAFGTVALRPYSRNAKDDVLLRDFTAIVAPSLEHSGFDALSLPRRMNSLRRHGASVFAGYAEAFDRTFAQDNAQLQAAYGVVIVAEE